VPLKVIHQGHETVIDDGATALIGSDASSTIRIVRPGISRRHAVISPDGDGWKVEDAGSRNGTFQDGHRVQIATVAGPTTVYLGHPSDGEELSLVPVGTEIAAPPPPSAEPEAFDLPAEPPPTAALADTVVARSTPAPRKTPRPESASRRVAAGQPVSDVEVAQLTAAIRDQVSAIKGLTWSVWAMIAATAALIVLTLFVGILSN
jgi:FHA domain